MAAEKKEDQLDVKTRLQSTSEACMKSYDAWSKDKKNTAAHQELQDAVHELRKVASRMEIEMVTNEGSSGSQKRMPIPKNRNASKDGNRGEGDKKPAKKKENDGNKDAVKESLKGAKKPEAPSED